MSHTPNKIAMLIAHTGFRDEEFLIPKEIFEAAGLEVVVVSNQAGEAVGQYGAVVRVNSVVHGIHADDFAAVVLVGGSGVNVFYNDSELFRILHDFLHQRKVIAAICSAPVILANAGLATSKKVTAFAGDKSLIEAAGAYFTGKTIENDGLVITASGPEFAKEFADEVLRAMDWHARGHHLLLSMQNTKKRF